MEIITNIQTLNGSTEPLQHPLSIHRGSVITTWNNELTDHWGKLFFVLDVRMHSNDVPHIGTGIVMVPFFPHLKDSITKKFTQYPKRSYPFELIEAELRSDFDNWVPTREPNIGEAGQMVMSKEAVPYDTKGVANRIEEMYKRGPNYQPNIPPPAHLVIAFLREYCTKYLHVDHWYKTRFAAMFDQTDFNRAKKVDRETKTSLYVVPTSIVSINRLCVFYDGMLFFEIHLKEDWKAGVNYFITTWKRQKKFQNPNR